MPTKAKPTARALQDSLDAAKIENKQIRTENQQLRVQIADLIARDRVATERVVRHAVALDAATARADGLQARVDAYLAAVK